VQDKHQITINDLLAIIDLINLASSRNAFRIEEFSIVGAIYQKLVNYVEASNAQKNLSTSNESKDQENDETRR
jgi:Ran GTPase-activating protein (RanGAP) involved in mRNA processing and transport